MLLDTYPAFELLRNGDWSYFELESYKLLLIYAAMTVLAAALLPRLLSKKPVTAPIVYLVIGAALHYVLPQKDQPVLMEEIWGMKRLTEMVVIVALTAAGLKLNKPFAKATWRNSKRLLLVGMPLTMLATFALGYWVFGFALATAALLAAVIAPTDPVLASDVQTSPPGGEDSSPTRVALTTEAGVNDGLAFPFTYLAIGLAVFGTSQTEWLWSWFVMDFVYKIAVGLLIGLAVGWLLNKGFMAVPAKTYESRVSTGILAIALTLLPYSLAELASSYGFVAVFAAACMFRKLEAEHTYQVQLHAFSEEIERVLVAVIFVLIGLYTANDLLSELSWSHVAFAALLIFAVRPLAGMVSMTGTRLHRLQKFTMAFFGIRGIGTLYYLSYALYHQSFPQAEEAFALVVFLMIASAVIHGISAPFVTERLDVVEKRQAELEKEQ